MAINFSQVKSLTIPEGSVKQIADSQGNILWQEKELNSITLSGQTTSLSRGAAFSFGGTVTANYTNGTTADVTSSTTFSGYNMSTTGTYTVTASYTEDGITKTATYILTVTKAWSTIWSGSKSISWSMSSSTPSAVTVYETSTLPNPSNIRVTFTMSNKINNGKYYLNGSEVSNKPSSPASFSSFDPTATHNYMLRTGATASGYSNEKYLQFKWDPYTYKFMISANSAGGVVPSSGTISMTITKIERYY